MCEQKWIRAKWHYHGPLDGTAHGSSRTRAPARGAAAALLLFPVSSQDAMDKKVGEMMGIAKGKEKKEGPGTG